MRILLVTHEFPPRRAGAGMLTHYLALGLSELGHQVLVFAPEYGKSDDTHDDAQPYEVRRMKRRGGRAFQFLFTAIWVLYARARGQWDHICLCDSGAHVSAALASPLLGKYALMTHGSEFKWYFGTRTESLRGRAKARIMKLLFMRAQRVTTNSHDTRRRLLEYLPGVEHKSIVVLPGIHVPEQTTGNLHRAERPLAVILTVGRLTPDKGHDVVLEAMADSRLATIDLSYRIVGTGPDHSRLENLAEELGIGNKVVFTGEVSDEQLTSEYDKADLFVLATRGDGAERVEGFGLVFVEAMSHGLPVIAGNVGGVPEAVRDGVDGILVDPRDVAELAGVMEQLIGDPARAHEMGSEGQKQALTEFSVRAMAERFLEALTDPSSDSLEKK